MLHVLISLISLFFTISALPKQVVPRYNWVRSVNTSAWYSSLDLCILQNTSRVDVDIILHDCQARHPQPAQVPRCTVGNAWRGPAKAPFCSSQDIPYSERTQLVEAVDGFDDPSQRPLYHFFRKLALKKGSVILIGDSVMQQFFGSIACELEREGIWTDPNNFKNTDEIKFVSADPSIEHSVPIKFTAVYHFVNGRYDRIANASMHAMKKSVDDFILKYDCVYIIANMGLHYVSNPLAHFSRVDYVEQMTWALQYLQRVSETNSKDIRVFFRETTAQHFPTPNGCECTCPVFSLFKPFIVLSIQIGQGRSMRPISVWAVLPWQTRVTKRTGGTLTSGTLFPRTSSTMCKCCLHIS